MQASHSHYGHSKGTEHHANDDTHGKKNEADAQQSPSHPFREWIKIHQAKLKHVGADQWLIVVATLVMAASAVVYSCYARGQLQTMKDTLAKSEDTAIKQLSPYVLYVSGTVKMDGAGRGYNVTIDTKNFGQTPALAVTRWIDSKVRKHLDDPYKTGIPSIEFPLKETELVTVDRGPGQPFQVTQHFELQSPIKPDDSLYVWGQVKYFNVFTRCQLEMFLLQTNQPIVSGATMDLSAVIIATESGHPCENTPYGPKLKTPQP